MSNSIQLSERDQLSKSQMNLLRKQGLVPAVVYGTDVGSISVTVSEKDILSTLKRNPRAILHAAIPQNGSKPVLLQNVQRDPISNKIVHVDFYQLNMNISMDSKVTIHFSGEPVGVKEGGILQVELYEVQVRCMPDKLLSAFEVDISGLGIGDHLLVSDLSFHEGIEVLSDATAMLVKISHAHAEEPAVVPA
ncbi:50S ribosomal protein L25 [Paenibacillus marchantiophytorum]|uniref:Large ribosomal subunit protein bL25 n=1 Tax=Paenibacillus marchantiophytorum TaxID=1619310 RepID=A0ABQ2BUM4_9BACL|nr:50S ribosomal protein L25 [Paenibacillus marchantiophytorum]GGI46129.1 50S ribosomal protein L25 [Paenibacillus marchantiophytorum]